MKPTSEYSEALELAREWENAVNIPPDEFGDALSSMLRLNHKIKTLAQALLKCHEELKSQHDDLVHECCEVREELQSQLTQTQERLVKAEGVIRYYAEPPTFMSSDGGIEDEDGNFKPFKPTKKTLIPGPEKARAYFAAEEK